MASLARSITFFYSGEARVYVQLIFQSWYTIYSTNETVTYIITHPTILQPFSDTVHDCEQSTNRIFFKAVRSLDLPFPGCGV